MRKMRCNLLQNCRRILSALILSGCLNRITVHCSSAARQLSSLHAPIHMPSLLCCTVCWSCVLSCTQEYKMQCSQVKAQLSNHALIQLCRLHTGPNCRNHSFSQCSINPSGLPIHSIIINLRFHVCRRVSIHHTEDMHHPKNMCFQLSRLRRRPLV